MKTIIFFALILLLAGCKKETFNLNEEISIDFNKMATVNIDGVPYEISFTNLEKETRCAPGSECWVPGSVVVKINLNNEQDFILGVMDYDISPMTEFKNHTIRLLDVSYGRNGNYGKEKHYSIKLRVD